MAYLKNWLPLAEALTRATGRVSAKAEAIKAQICELISDRRIHVRLTAAGTAHVYDGLNVYVPKRISLTDFDWINSKPLAPWYVGPAVSWKRDKGWWSDPPHEIALIELNRSELDSAFVTERNDRRAGAKSTKRDAVKAYIDKYYPDGPPSDQPYKTIVGRMAQDGLRVDERTLRRALGRK